LAAATGRRKHAIAVYRDGLSRGLEKPGFIDRHVTPRNLFGASGLAGAILLLMTPFWDDRAQVYWAGLSLALMGWLFSSSVIMSNRLKQHSFDLILKTRFEMIYRDSIRDIRKEFPRMSDVITKKRSKEIFRGKANKEIKLRLAINTLLNFYEVLAISVWFQDADEMILREYFREIIRNFWIQVKNIIPLWRAENKDVFTYLEWLCESRWAVKSDN